MKRPVDVVPLPAPAGAASRSWRVVAAGVCSALAALTAPAQEAPPTAGLAFRGVWLDDVESDGARWARGETYKLAVTSSGVTYYPFLATKAERHRPVCFALAEAHCGGEPLACAGGAVWRSGPRQVRIARGAFTEVWDLAADHAEQSFVFERAPGSGELRLAIACDTELAAQSVADGVLRFVDATGAGVACSDAIVTDATGRAQRLPIEWARGQMVLRVAEAFLADAQWPVVVDPLVRTIAVGTSLTQLAEPRATFDPLTGVWLVTCEDRVTATDTDVLAFRLAQDGTVLESLGLAISTADTVSPDAAALGEHGSLVVAWIDRASDRLRWRRRGPSSGFGVPVGVAIGPQPADAPLALGGSKNGELALACFTAGLGPARAAFVTTIDLADNVAPLVQATGTFSTITDLGLTDRLGSGEDWGLVLRTTSGAEFRGVLTAATIGPILVSGPVPLAPGGLAPRICGFGPFWAVWLDAGSPAAVRVAQISPFRGHTFVVDFVENLSALEGGGTNVVRRSELALASDGCRFVYAYREDQATRPTATVLNTVRVRNAGSGILNRCVFDERRIGIGRAGPEASLCAAGATGGSGGAYLHLVASDAPNSALAGTLYDGRQPGDMFTAVSTQCGAPFAPLIGGTGSTALGATFTVALARTVGAPLLFVSLAEPAPLPLCAPNPNCRLGVQLPAALSIPGTRVDLPVPCDANLLGSTLACQGIDVTGPGGCPATVFGIDFRMTDTVLATIR